MDIFSKTKRAEIMSRVKNRGSQIEKVVFKELSRHGLKYRKNSKKLFGKPDIVSKSDKIVIFVDSCFWHGCKKHKTIPATRNKFWRNKIKRNMFRDKEVTKYYRKRGWKIFRIWEHDIKNNLDGIVERIKKEVR